MIIKITETNQGLPPASPAVLPCSGEPPAGMTGELFAGNGLLSNDLQRDVLSVPTHNAAATHTHTHKTTFYIHAFWLGVHYYPTDYFQTGLNLIGSIIYGCFLSLYALYANVTCSLT